MNPPNSQPQKFSLSSILLPKVDILNFPLEFDYFIQNFEPSSADETLMKPESKKRKVKKSCSEAEGRENKINLDLLPNIRNYLRDFELVLRNSIEYPVCKGKYLMLQIMLKSCKTLIFPQNETIDIDLQVYTCDNKEVKKNMKGLDIIKGNSSRTMHFFKPADTHVTYFLFQITEVSSHYPKKFLSLKFQPKLSPFLESTGYIIQPLTIPNLKIQAKKLHR